MPPARRSVLLGHVLAALAFSSGNALAGGDASGLFPNPSLPAGDSPRGVATADMDGDGRPDIVVANYTGGDLSTLLVAPGGGFLPERRSPTGGFPAALGLGDVDGDGVPDAVVASLADGVFVHRGSPDGTFAGAEVLVSDPAAPDVLLHDLDGDGEVDLVSGSRAGPATNEVLVWRGDGAGGFELSDVHAVPRFIESIALGHLDSDGITDLVVLSVGVGTSNNSTITSLFGVGDGTYVSGPIEEVPGPMLTRLALGDIDADDLDDLAITSGFIKGVLVRPGLGDGVFGGSATLPLDRVPNDVTFVDINGDGRLDLAASIKWQFRHSVALFLNQNGRLGDVPLDVVTRPAEGLAFADLDRDGAPEMIAVGGGAVGVVAGDRRVLFKAPVGRAAAADRDLAIGDVTGDGWPDVLTGTAPTLYRGSPSGTLGDGEALFARLDTDELELVDMDGDGRLDLVTIGSGGVRIALGADVGVFGAPTTFTVSSGPALAVADMDGDGAEDVLTANGFVDAAFVAFGDGVGGLGAPVNVPVHQGPGGFAPGDVDGDGHVDLVVLSPKSTFTNPTIAVVTVRLNTGDGTFGPLTRFTLGDGLSDVRVADLDDDGRLDLIGTDPSSETVTVRLGLGDGDFAFPSGFPAGACSSPSLADLDGDGSLDVAAAGGAPYSVTVLLGRGNGSLAAPARFGTGGKTSVTAVADLDLDGDAEIIAGYSGRVVVFENGVR